jgi:hypothetical protein
MKSFMLDHWGIAHPVENMVSIKLIQIECPSVVKQNRKRSAQVSSILHQMLQVMLPGIILS